MTPIVTHTRWLCLGCALALVLTSLVGGVGVAGAAEATHASGTGDASSTVTDLDRQVPRLPAHTEPCDTRITSVAEWLATSTADERGDVDVVAEVTATELTAVRATEEYSVADLVTADVDSPSCSKEPTE